MTSLFTIEQHNDTYTDYVAVANEAHPDNLAVRATLSQDHELGTWTLMLEQETGAYGDWEEVAARPVTAIEAQTLLALSR